jgi:excisionase family DNA binding protein
METKTYTTDEAAKKIGISRQTLYTWIDAGKIEAPKQIHLGKRSMRLWTKADIELVRNFKGTLKSGLKSTRKKKISGRLGGRSRRFLNASRVSGRGASSTWRKE